MIQATISTSDTPEQQWEQAFAPALGSEYPEECTLYIGFDPEEPRPNSANYGKPDNGHER